MPLPAIIAAVATIAGTIQSVTAQREAAQQSEYDAQFQAEQARINAEQERMNREVTARSEARDAQEAKQRRLGMLTRAGGGIGVSALQELSRQASIDEINIQNANLLSRQKRKSLGLSATNALLAGRSRAGALRSASVGTLFSGIGSTAGIYARAKAKE